jgi:hypothetical protein
MGKFSHLQETVLEPWKICEFIKVVLHKEREFQQLDFGKIVSN